MKRPSFQFYPADWRNNAKLRRCSEPARGAWMDVLCILHDSDEYGVIRWPLADIARASGVPLRLLKELNAKQVLKGHDKSCDGYEFTPRHAGKDGEPVTLVNASTGPCWFCSRMVRDEYIRIRRGGTTQFSDTNQPLKPTPKSAPKVSPKPPFGDGPSSASSSASSSSSPTTQRVVDVGDVDEWGDSLPMHAANRMAEVAKKINSLHPAWRKRPHFSAKELHCLHDNSTAWLGVSEDDWRLLNAYMDAAIPAEWRKDPRDFLQNDNRLGLIGMGPSSVLSNADRWERECRKRRVATGIEKTGGAA